MQGELQESFWVLSGLSSADPLLCFWLPFLERAAAATICLRLEMVCVLLAGTGQHLAAVPTEGESSWVDGCLSLWSTIGHGIFWTSSLFSICSNVTTFCICFVKGHSTKWMIFVHNHSF